MMPFEFLLKKKKKKGYKLIFAPLHVYVVEFTLRTEFEHYLLLKCSNLVKPMKVYSTNRLRLLLLLLRLLLLVLFVSGMVIS